MQILRDCLSLCFAPNTVSKFVRFFPRFAVLFFVVHVTIILYLALFGSGKHPVKNAQLSHEDIKHTLFGSGKHPVKNAQLSHEDIKHSKQVLERFLSHNISSGKVDSNEVLKEVDKVKKLKPRELPLIQD